MKFEIKYVATQIHTVKQNISVIGGNETALTRKFMDEFPDAEEICVVGDIGRSNKGKTFALMRGKIKIPIENTEEVTADDAREAIRFIEEELENVESFRVLSINVVAPELKFRKRRAG